MDYQKQKHNRNQPATAQQTQTRMLAAVDAWRDIVAHARVLVCFGGITLREFAVMGHFYAQEVIGTPAPRAMARIFGVRGSSGRCRLWPKPGRAVLLAR